MTLKKWEQLEYWICEQLKELDPYIRRTPGSGNKGCKGDIKFSNNYGLHIECKFRNTKSVTINHKVWQKLNEEIPLHSERIPMLALENEDGKRFAVLDLDNFLDLYIKLWRLENERN